MTSLNPVEKVTVIIVTYNGGQWIEACLRSVLASDCPVDVVVVDNCSSDQTTQIVRTRFKEVQLIYSPSNIGFGAANNLGIKSRLDSGSNFFLLLNQDTTIEMNTISQLVNAFKSGGSKYGVFSPVHLNSAGTGYDIGFQNYIRSYLGLDKLPEGTGEIVEIGFVNAAAWLVPREVLRKVGGFAPLFFHYGEDRDFVNRMTFHSLRVGIVCSAFIRHYRDGRNMSVAEWITKRKRKYYFVGWLSRAGDINKSVVSGWLNGFGWCAREWTVQLVKLKFSIVLVSVVVMAKMFLIIPALVRHRRQVRSKVDFKFLS